jgi:2-methylcitrate dehydratase PrpD
VAILNLLAVATAQVLLHFLKLQQAEVAVALGIAAHTTQVTTVRQVAVRQALEMLEE